MPIPIWGERTCLARVMRSGGEIGKVEVAKAAVRSTSPGRTTVGVAGALSASVLDAPTAASKVAMAVVVFMVPELLWKISV